MNSEQSTPKQSMVKHLDHLNLTVEDLEASLDWYQRVFGFTVVERGQRGDAPWAIIRAGEALLAMYEAGAHDEPSHYTAPVVQHRINHFALRIVDEAAWEATVEREGIALRYGGAVRWPHSTAWYLKDPNGYEIEVARWRHDVIAFDPLEPAAAEAA